MRLPADYWKVAVAKRSGGRRAVGYLHTPNSLSPTVEEAFGEFKTHWVPTHILAELSGLDFEAVMLDDMAGGGFETMEGLRLAISREDIGL